MPVDTKGWLRHDSLRFVVPQLEPGRYDLTLTLRTTSRYPYTQLSLILRCRDKAHTFSRSDTVTFPVTDAKGVFQGHGTAIHEYFTPLTPITLDTATAVIFTVTHNMSQDALPGITDLGLTIEQQ